ncbi:MAG: PHP domain-containing protein [Gemmatimonadota bacterium]
MITTETLRVDLHSHTRHSPDAGTSPADLVERAREVGLDRIAVTDHGTIEGALRAREAAPDLVIVGEEIRCACRTELIGLFLTESIPMRLSLEEVVERIRDQGGVVYAPHPFAYPRSAVSRGRRALAVADIAEVVNARAFLPIWNHAAGRAARKRGLAPGAGSDAHFPGEIGRAYTKMPAFRSAAEFLTAASEARPVSRMTSSPLVHVASMSLKIARRVADWGASSRSVPAPRTVPAE